MYAACRRQATQYLQERGYSVFDPWAAWGGGAKPQPAVAHINLQAVRFSTVLLGYIPETATGTAMETGYALACGIPVYQIESQLARVVGKKPHFHSCSSSDGVGVVTQSDFEGVVDYVYIPVFGVGVGSATGRGCGPEVTKKRVRRPR